MDPSLWNNETEAVSQLVVEKSAPCLFHLLLAQSKKPNHLLKMDFQSLTRRELQTLCKKNKIPANMTNVAMADALNALQTSSTVEGIEELLLLSKQPSASSIESPAKSQLTSSLSAPRTRTTRRKTVKGESETLHTLTNTTTRLRSTTKLVAAGVFHDTLNNVAQTPSGTGACRKMEIQFKDSQDCDTNKTAKEIDNFSETPAIVPATLKRFPKVDNTIVRQMRGSRRSARLADKNKVDDFNNVKEKETFETVKTELFSGVFGESWDISVKEPSNDVDTVTETSEIDMKETSDQGLDKNSNEEAVSGAKSNCSIDNNNGLQIGCQVDCDGDKGPNSETLESKMAVESDAAEEDRSTDGSDNLACKVEDAPENGKELNTNEEMGSNDVVAGITEDVTDHNEAFSVDNSANFKMGDQESESNGDLKLSCDTSASFKDGKELNNEKEVESKDCAAQCLDKEKDKNSEDLDSLNITDGVKSRNVFTVSGECELDQFVVPKSEKQDEGNAPALESMIEISNCSAEEVFATNVAEKLTAMELNTSATDQEKSFTCSESKMSWVECAAEPSNAEEESRKNLSSNNADAVMPEQLSNDEVVEGDPMEEEDLNSYEALEFEECSSKQLGALDGERYEFEECSRTVMRPSYLAPLVVTANITGNVPVQPCLTVAADSNENLTDYVVATTFTPVKESPTSRKISPLRKSVNKTPTAAKRMMMPPVSDDKENIADNSGSKLIVAKEEKEKKDTRQENFHKSLDEQSLRMLTKMLKEKLEITKKLNKNDKKTNTKVATTTARPALQALSENRLVGDS